ncbi:undecaprenyl-diphosphate phosphatase [Bacillus canaveralius]|uniref:undecaprenyl-diphosphate phosphatase n=1 Tax=Bacillus canaveralius TaxID=1403243 RepID=UPI000F7B5CAC|nr:undecaprenyl-diphosphate phosphatase [Bacillus canaveralius]RSK52941.1 undecaprenyl-diphosphate phosphatase [Bacillus canaveralius]
MNLWEIFAAIVLGIVEGLTEFIPVSSTGHMIIVDDLMFKSKELFSKEVANTFKVVIQLGSILAVVIIFRERFKELLGLKKGSAGGTASSGPRLQLKHVIVGLFPAAFFGFLLEDTIDTHLFSVYTVLIGLVIGAVFMLIADFLPNKVTTTHSVDQITWKQAIGVGLFQCIALWPGFSRSGSTISGGVILGMSHRAASDFTFIMAVPIMLGASGLSLLKNWQFITIDALPFFIAGFISAFIFAMISIRFFLALINKIKLVPFAIYRIVLAAVIYIVFL